MIRSTAKRVRRHGVDPNRSCNEGVMLHSLEPSRPADFRERFLPTQTTVSGNTGPKRTTSLPSISPAPPQPPSATVVAGNFHETGRVRQFFPKICGSSFSFVSQPNRSSKAPGARQKSVEVRGIHHRANYSFRARVSEIVSTGENFGISQKYRGDSAEFSAEV
ncbi:DNAse I-like superfamily protein [Prunus dulcis]|uniref:DNAse I-like superfamily protein n=1 Tax=Prunus dulcis TaxID=3755 RepID=A0A5H2XNJ4_PRUDU|nr:DNAse I-like superfamily protein [Prunus dulcis]